MRALSVAALCTIVVSLVAAIPANWPFSAPQLNDQISIASPSQGDIFFDVTDAASGSFKGYDGTAWVAFGAGSEYEQRVLSQNTATSTANTYIDVAGATITLDPGTWLVGYDVALFLEYEGGGQINLEGNLAVMDGADVSQAGSLALFSHRQTSQTQQVVTNVSRQFRVQVGPMPTAFRLRVRSARNGPEGIIHVLGAPSHSGDLSNPDPDIASVFWALRLS